MTESTCFLHPIEALMCFHDLLIHDFQALKDQALVYETSRCQLDSLLFASVASSLLWHAGGSKEKSMLTFGLTFSSGPFFSEVYISIRLSSYVNFVYIAHKQTLPLHSVYCLAYQTFRQALKMYQHVCVLGSGLRFLMGTHLYVISLVSISDY